MQGARHDRATDYGPSVGVPLRHLLKEPAAKQAFTDAFGFDLDASTLNYVGHLNAWQLSVMNPAISVEMLSNFDRLMTLAQAE